MSVRLIEKIFSVKNENNHKVIRILGIKIKFYYPKEIINAIKTQNKYDLNKYIKTDKLIVFIEVEVARTCGGQMSIFELCRHSQDILAPVPVCMTTMPGKNTYAHNDYFDNDIEILRWQQVMNIIKQKKEVIIHIPEFMTELFMDRLSKSDKHILCKIPKLQINILNQRIDIMPDKKIVDKLKRITTDITQTTAHNSYSTQEICDKYGIPLHKFSVNLGVEKYSYLSKNKIEKIILISPDRPVDFSVDCFIKCLERKLPDYKIIPFYNMSFSECMKLTSKTFFTVTFGEGFDGYFIHPLFVERLGAAVYNKEFFPDENWLNFKNIYNSYEDICFNFAKDVRYFENNMDEYYSLVKQQKDKISHIYNFNEYIDNIKRFYNRKYDFYPQAEAKNEVSI